MHSSRPRVCHELTPGKHLIDLRQLLRFGQQPLGRLLLQRGDLIRVAGHAENQIADGRQAATTAEDILVRKGRREVIMASSRRPNRYSLYSTVLMMEIIIIR